MMDLFRELFIHWNFCTIQRFLFIYPNQLFRKRMTTYHLPKASTEKRKQMLLLQILYRNDYLLCVLVLIPAPTYGINSTCSAPAVQSGKTAWVTCYFDDDLSTHHRNIYVDHVSKGGHGMNKETVITIQWSSKNHSVQELSGYKLVGFVTEQLTFKIPKATKQHAGVYWCDFFRASKANLHHCELHVIDSEFQKDDSLVSSHLPADNEALKHIIEDIRSDTQKVVIILCNVFALILIVSVYFLVKSVWHKRKKKTSHTARSNYAGQCIHTTLRKIPKSSHDFEVIEKMQNLPDYQNTKEVGSLKEETTYSSLPLYTSCTEVQVYKPSLVHTRDFT